MKILTCIVLVFVAASVYAQEDSLMTYPENEYSTPVDENTDEEGGSETEEAVAPTHTLIAPENLPKTEEYKTEKISVKKFNREKWKETVGKTVYTEKQEKQKPEEEEKKSTDVPPVNLPWAAAILQPLFYILIIGIIALLIYFVVRNASSLNYRLRKDSLASEDISKPIENIEELDVNTLLQEALATGNLKLAVRLYYLALLKKLNEAAIISWKKDKTNRDYLDELLSRNYQYDEIRHLTLAYEEVWYGDHTITRELFDKISVRFENVREQINVSRQP